MNQEKKWEVDRIAVLGTVRAEVLDNAGWMSDW